ncbi:MAG: hypothetical protein HYZ53_03835 [Planctomycetes bacterium]|nr:hypothetical protein [Planctomycetota bacterium]
MDAAGTDVPYRTYWRAWGCLLALTLGMVLIGHPAVLLAGMTLKAAIIAFVFMHLKFERAGLVVSVLVGIFATSLVLFLLLIPDGLAM